MLPQEFLQLERLREKIKKNIQRKLLNNKTMTDVKKERKEKKTQDMTLVDWLLTKLENYKKQLKKKHLIKL